ncbi:hypothetical protein BC829DRAFT_127936 [Chytridium lagenaria]|nr:hypothetical protein BC829DRAFT_127936 [Chytridium lagenaria]
MLVSFIPSLFLFGWLTEAPFLRHSFATIKNWSFGMHATVYIAVVVIFGVLGYLIRLAYVTRVDPDGLQSILGWYLVLLAIPVILLFSGIFSAWVQNRDGLLKRTVSSSSTDALQDACQTTPKWKRVSLHPHHWAISTFLPF